MSATQEQDAGIEVDEGEVERLLASARDALTDDMVTRLSATATDSLDLLDRINRSGIADALPTLAQMVKNGDLERVAALVRLMGSAEDALTDDMVTRLAQTAGGSIDLLDRVNRSGIARALPAITALLDNGDLERLVGLARLVASAEEALSDDIVNRLARTAGELMCLLDKLTRTPGLWRMIDLVSRPEMQATFTRLLEGLDGAQQEVEASAPAKGGLGEAMKLAKDPDLHEALKFAAAFGRQLKKR